MGGPGSGRRKGSGKGFGGTKTTKRLKSNKMRTYINGKEFVGTSKQITKKMNKNSSGVKYI